MVSQFFLAFKFGTFKFNNNSQKALNTHRKKEKRETDAAKRSVSKINA